MIKVSEVIFQQFIYKDCSSALNINRGFKSISEFAHKCSFDEHSLYHLYDS